MGGYDGFGYGGYGYTGYPFRLPITVPAQLEHFAHFLLAFLGLSITRVKRVSHSGHFAGIVSGYLALPLFGSYFKKGGWAAWSLSGLYGRVTGAFGQGKRWQLEDWHVALLFVAGAAALTYYGLVGDSDAGRGAAEAVGRGEEEAGRDEDARERAREASLRKQRERELASQPRRRMNGSPSSSSSSSSRGRNFGSGTTGGEGGSGRDQDAEARRRAAEASLQRQKANDDKKKKNLRRRTGGGVSGLVDMRENMT